MWQFSEARARHPRRVPGAGRAGGQRQRQLLQRDRRPGDPADADHCDGRPAGGDRAPHHAVVQGRGRRHRPARAHARRARRQRVPGVAHGLVRGAPPWIDLDVEKRVQELCWRPSRRAWCARRTTSREGGLAVALAECCISGPARRLGAAIELEGGDPARRAAVRRKPVAHHCCRCAAATVRLRELAAAAEVPLSRARRSARPPTGDRPLIDLDWSSAVANACRARTTGRADATGKPEHGTGIRTGQPCTPRSPVHVPASGSILSGQMPRCLTAFTTSAASSASSATPRRRTSPTSVSTRCSTAARNRPASSRPNGDALISHRGMGLVADVFNAGHHPQARGHGGDRPHALLDAAARRCSRTRSRSSSSTRGGAGGGAQRQPGQRRGAARAARGARLDLPVDGRHRGDRSPDRRRRRASALIDRVVDALRAGARRLLAGLPHADAS